MSEFGTPKSEGTGRRSNKAITDVVGRPGLSSSGALDAPVARAEIGDGFGPRHLSSGTNSFAGCGPINYIRTDIRIFEDVCEALTDDPRLDAREVEVRVDGGIVYLQGAVDSPYSARLAEHLATLCKGVKRVENLLEVALPSQRT